MNKKELETWAEKALAFYNKTAPVVDLAFWQFQKPADFDNECELLLIGLNPGGGWNFAGQYNNENKWKPYFNGQEMTLKGFLGGNTSWDKGPDWAFVKGLLYYIGLNLDTLKDEHSQYINCVPFSTHDVKVLFGKVNKEIIDKCFDLTAEYIRLLSPKKIIVMGTASVIDRFTQKDRGELQTLLSGKIRYVVRAALCGVSTFAIAHPSAYRRVWKEEVKEAKEKMKEMIQLYLDNREDEIKPVRIM